MYTIKSGIARGIINSKSQLQQERIWLAKIVHPKKQLQDELPFDTTVTNKLTSKKSLNDQYHFGRDI